MNFLYKILPSILIPVVITVSIWAFLTYYQLEDESLKEKNASIIEPDPLANKRRSTVGAHDIKQFMPRAKMLQMDHRLADLEHKVGTSDEANKKDPMMTDPDPSADSENLHDVVRQKREETVARIFASDNHDYEWEDNMSSQIKQLLTKDDFSSSALVDMECRQNLCRITFSHSGEESRDSFSMDFVSNAPPHSHLWGRPFYDDTKGYGTELYLTRKGYSIFPESDMEAKKSLQ